MFLLLGPDKPFVDDTSKAKDRVKRLRAEGKRNPANDLESTIWAAEAAGRLRKPSGEPHSKIISDCRLVAKYVPELPVVVMATITKQYTIGLSKHADKKTAWLATVALDVRDDIQQWSVEEPTMSSVWAAITSRGIKVTKPASPLAIEGKKKKVATPGDRASVASAAPGDESAAASDGEDLVETSIDFTTLYHETIFSDHVLTLVANVSSQPERDDLLGLLSVFLEWFVEVDRLTLEAAEDDDAGGKAGPITEASMAILEPVVRAARGLHALLCPVPGRYGSSHSDVAYLFPDTKEEVRNAVDRHFKFGKSLAHEMQLQSQWQVMLKAYHNVISTEVACQGPLSKADSALRAAHKSAERWVSASGDLSEAMPPDLANQCSGAFELFTSSRPSWDRLRPGATKDIDSLAAKLLKIAVDSELSKPSRDIAKLRSFAVLAKLSKALELDSAILDALNSQTSATLKDRISIALAATLKDPAEVSELLAAYRAVKFDGALTNEIMTKMQDTRESLMAYFADQVQLASVEKKDLDDAHALANHFMNDTELQNPNEDLAQIDKNNLVALLKFSGLILNFTAALKHQTGLTAFDQVSSRVEVWKASSQHGQVVKGETAALASGTDLLGKVKSALFSALQVLTKPGRKESSTSEIGSRINKVHNFISLLH